MQYRRQGSSNRQQHRHRRRDARNSDPRGSVAVAYANEGRFSMARSIAREIGRDNLAAALRTMRAIKRIAERKDDLSAAKGAADDAAELERKCSRR
jgi:hypothetical protein